MTKLLFVTAIFILSVLPQSYAQNIPSDSSSIKVDSIKISGNKITDEYVILRELTFTEGDTVNSEILSYNKERIYSLGIFSDVKITPEVIDGENIVNILVSESWYIYPIPFAQIKDNDWKKLSYGIDLYLLNFKGMNDRIRLHAAFGYDPNYQVSYSNPYFIKNEDIFLKTNLSYVKARNKSDIAKSLYGGDFDQKISGGDISIGKRIGLYQKVFINLGYKIIDSPEYIYGVSASGERIDHLLSTGIGYSYDTRDLVQFPREGLFLQSAFTFNGLGIDNINYKVFGFDVRKYLKITDEFSIKARFESRFTFGDLVPYYDYSFLGFNERVRGYFYKEREGNNRYLISTEITYPVIKDFILNLDFIPILPKELLSYRVAVYAELFADAGTTQMKNQPLTLRSIDSGYGAGLTFLFLPYSAFRIEYAINDFGKKQWILGIGTSF